MTSRERFARMFAHKEADRVPVLDGPWGTTLERWRREGMPAHVDWRDYFDLDKTAGIGVDNSPRFEQKTVEETPEYVIQTTAWGATVKNWKHITSTPQDLDFRIKTRADWEKVKKTLVPTRDRVNWDHLKRDYPAWKKEDRWIAAGLWFGFDIMHSRVMGTERFLMTMADDPDLCVDMFTTFLDLGLALLDQVWDAGYHWHCFEWPDDMGYKGKQFFSLDMYRELLKPAHKRATDWAHAKGTYVRIHSCGDVRPFVPEFLDIGIDCLNPIEVKAGMDPVALKKSCGDRLVLHGGINAVLWDQPEVIRREIERVVPILKRDGGYIFASDHSIPSSVSLNDFRSIVALLKKTGSYE